jgi:hypothetical protein
MGRERRAFEGCCHCGAIQFVFRTAILPQQWPLRACQCSFCRSHGARTTSDPGGALEFRIADPSKLRRYRFGTRTSDFLLCSDCGTYVAATIKTAAGRYATLNVNAIRPQPALPDATPVSYDQESAVDRQARRERLWTPLTGDLPETTDGR